MFGLSTKEILFKSIVNACRNCENTYKNSIIENLDGLKNADNGTSKKNAFVARRKYLDDVSNKVIDSFRLSSPTIFCTDTTCASFPFNVWIRGIKLRKWIHGR